MKNFENFKTSGTSAIVGISLAANALGLLHGCSEYELKSSLNSLGASLNSSGAAEASVTQPVVLDPEGGWVTGEQIAQIQKIPTGPNATGRRAGAIHELGTPYRQLPATSQSEVVYEYRIKFPTDSSTRLVLGFTANGIYNGYGLRYGYHGYTDNSLR